MVASFLKSTASIKCRTGGEKMSGWVQDLVSWLFGISLFVNAVLFFPQIVRLWRQKNSKDVSLMTFGGFCIMQLIAVCYGYFKGDSILVFGYLLSLFSCGLVTFLIVFYRFKQSKNSA
jgi:MtN3 and saliva related transmembrane protein